MKNKWEKRDGHIVLFANGCGQIHEILIDEADLETVAAFPGTWRAHKGGGTYYAEIVAGFTDGKQKIIRMHRVILNPPIGLDVDHKNHNGLDNRRVNIRVATRGENARNARNNVQFQSDADGVTWNVRNKTWQVQVKVNDRWEYLASIKDRIIAEAAAFMYRETGKRVRWSNPRENSLAVCWNAKDQAWQAYPRVNGKRVFLGCYDTNLEAKAASSMYLETGMFVKRSRKRKHTL